jgi:hypothetical protein
VPADASNTANQNDRCLAPPCGEHHAGMQSVPPCTTKLQRKDPAAPGNLVGKQGLRLGKPIQQGIL